MAMASDTIDRAYAAYLTMLPRCTVCGVPCDPIRFAIFGSVCIETFPDGTVKHYCGQHLPDFDDGEGGSDE
jgi:hypothetical protein